MATAILDALRAAGGSLKPGALQKKVGLSPHTLRAHLAPLIKQGTVIATGATMNRIFSLSSKRDAPPVPPAAPASTPAPASASPAKPAAPASTMAAGFSLAEARDAAIKARLKSGKATFDELVAVLPPERGESDENRRDACKRALKRLMLKGLVADVGDKFHLL